MTSPDTDNSVLVSKNTSELALADSALKEFSYVVVKTAATLLKPGWTGFNQEYTVPDHLLQVKHSLHTCDRGLSK